MADDVRIATGLRNHRKTKRLRRLLGADACWSLVCLFLWAGEERWTGDLAGLSDLDIEEEANWEGEGGALVAALIEVGFLVGDEGERAIHDWKDHNPYAASKGERIARGKAGAAARWSKKSMGSDATSMPQACGKHAGSNADGINKQCPPAPAPTPTNSVAIATGADAPAEVAPDPIWGTGLAFLRRKGIPTSQARSLLGRVRKEAGDAETAALLLAAEAQDISDPGPWLLASARRARAGPKPQPMGKTAQALLALEELSNGGLDSAGSFGGVQAADVLEPGADAGSGGYPADRRRLAGGFG